MLSKIPDNLIYMAYSVKRLTRLSLATILSLLPMILLIPVQAQATEPSTPLITEHAVTQPATGNNNTTTNNTTTIDCSPFSKDLTKCDNTVPVHYLEDGDPADAYKGFSFSTSGKTSSAKFDENWVDSTGSYGHAWFPKKNGASLRLNKVSTWTDAYNDKHEIDAVLTVTDSNAGGLFDYASSISMMGCRDFCKISYGIDSPLGYDSTRRSGIELKVSFYYAGTSTPVPSDFKGLTGFVDLDGAEPGKQPGEDQMEGVEMVSGFNEAWVVKDNHLHEYGQNGLGGWTDEDYSQQNLDAHGRKHFVTAAFSGPEFTVRFSDGYAKATRATVFNTPVLASALVYKVTGKAVDETGKTIKTWTIADNLHQTASYSSKPPVITGYELVQLHSDSEPQEGKITDHDVTVIYEYKEIILHSIPVTGSREIDLTACLLLVTIIIVSTVSISDRKGKKHHYKSR